MAKVNYQEIIDKQKRGITFYTVLCVLFVGLIGAYTYFNWVDYSLHKEAVAQNETVIQDLKSQTVSEKSEYQNQKKLFDDLSDGIDASLKEVFPAGDDYTELTRAFDHFESETDRNNNKFVISNIEYQDIQVSEDGAYKCLPLRMTISSSEENFTKFLQYIEKSGSLLDKVRLMDIQSIHMSFDESENSSGVINFSVKINAYFQNI
ncbi:MAG: hypothetical protein WC604_02700 [Candidatus Gracilibacteria bacterium]